MMDTLLSIGLSHQGAMLRRMDVIANNIANASTTAFKRERVVFQDYLFTMKGEGPKELRDVRMVLDYGVVPDMSKGEFIMTRNPLDVAMENEGFMVIQSDEGERLYTRNGNFRINIDGELTTQTGQRVLGVNDQPIRINPDDTNIIITEDGTMRSDLGDIGQIQMVQFANYQGLERRGDSLFATEREELPPAELRLVQGALEGSNVNPIEQVTSMINVLRSYQSMERSLNTYSEQQDRAIDRLSQVQA
ncbi:MULTISPECIES: flagellar basal-body rod protein FlgF [unclassified Iodidimonas]|uniref:flagellar basal-body rod protein FlgF n=1 Tax=unclassified Iodidimonas TaxID=2626145 RepID=UPI0024829F00|nr:MULTISPECIES: flagellar basal-body rod protein FlgF [unclassified Iodidimonas]